MDSHFVFGRTKNKMIGKLNTRKMCQGGRTSFSSKRSISYVICALTFFHLAAYNNLQNFFCNALPPVAQDTTDDVAYDSDISNNTRVIIEEDKDTNIQNEKISPSSSYMDHKGLFCGARMSDLVTLNVTSR